MRFVLTCLFLLVSMVAFGQVLPPEIDPGKELINLILNWKNLGPLAIGTSVVLILIQISKTEFFGKLFKKLKPEYKRLFVVVLGQVYGILFLVQSGSSFLNAILVGLISSGGAVAIWEAIKPLIEKKP